ncbi:hypothetical protein CLV77_0557 [Brevirhabdus pacifica]|uniref:hypothetical protein n=1 Tax=Brevirhabdus pacifica TaxID=1267768 RepID=UPI000CBA22E4|nr:hypothetical protein [Brevirhabdus pacifica]PJJ86025.1 hypothetical protein CLV77_0557 [Brevirhabdus pacifica]
MVSITSNPLLSYPTAKQTSTSDSAPAESQTATDAPVKETSASGSGTNVSASTAQAPSTSQAGKATASASADDARALVASEEDESRFAREAAIEARDSAVRGMLLSQISKAADGGSGALTPLAQSPAGDRVATLYGQGQSEQSTARPRALDMSA